MVRLLLPLTLREVSALLLQSSDVSDVLLLQFSVAKLARFFTESEVNLLEEASIEVSLLHPLTLREVNIQLLQSSDVIDVLLLQSSVVSLEWFFTERVARLLLLHVSFVSSVLDVVLSVVRLLPEQSSEVRALLYAMEKVVRLLLEQSSVVSAVLYCRSRVERLLFAHLSVLSLEKKLMPPSDEMFFPLHSMDVVAFKSL